MSQNWRTWKGRDDQETSTLPHGSFNLHSLTHLKWHERSRFDIYRCTAAALLCFLPPELHHKSKLHRKGLGIHFDWRNFSCTGKAKKNLDAPLQIEASKKYFTTGVEACSHIYYTSTRQQQYVGGMRLSHFCGMTLFDIHNCLLAWNIIVIPNFAVTDSSLLSCLCFRIKASVHRQNSWKGKLTWALRPRTNSCTAGCGSDLWLSKNSTKSTLFALGSGISSKF